MKIKENGVVYELQKSSVSAANCYKGCIFFTQKYEKCPVIEKTQERLCLSEGNYYIADQRLLTFRERMEEWNS